MGGFFSRATRAKTVEDEALEDEEEQEPTPEPEVLDTTVMEEAEEGAEGEGGSMRGASNRGGHPTAQIVGGRGLVGSQISKRNLIGPRLRKPSTISN